MKYKSLIIVVIFVAISYCVCLEEGSYKKYERNKRHDGAWVWGDVTSRSYNNNLRQTFTTAAPPTQPNPCTPIKPKKPNFTNKYRISEAKCFEYIWELKNRADKKKREDACLKYQEGVHEANGGGLFHTAAIGGRNTLPGEFPHMGALGWRAVIGTWIFKCGSSLISPKFLLTAAHCSQVSAGDTTVANTKPEIVRLGDKNIIDQFANDQNPMDVGILRFIVHPNYMSPKKYFDIALIEISTEVVFDKYIQPACLWTKADTRPLGTEASLTGWGTVDAAKQQTSPELQAAFVNIIDSNLCNELLRPAFNRHFNIVEPHQICAGVPAGGVDSCQGDSGGPLQVKIQLPITTEGSMSYVIGVTSFGFGCARPNTPGVYTRVSSFIHWIESIVWR